MNSRSEQDADFSLCRFTESDISLKVGEYDFGQEGETIDATYRVERIISHEGYNTRTYENDIGKNINMKKFNEVLSFMSFLKIYLLTPTLF